MIHSLRELLATGLVTQTPTKPHELPPRAVIPLRTLIACANDLATGESNELERE
jgi:hypothetical protein